MSRSFDALALLFCETADRSPRVPTEGLRRFKKTWEFALRRIEARVLAEGAHAARIARSRTSNQPTRSGSLVLGAPF